MSLRGLGKRFFKLFVAGGLALMIICACAVWVRAEQTYPKPTTAFFVNDFAGVLDSGDSEQMQKSGEQLYEKTTAQVVVVTVSDMGGKDIESYSIGLARQWGIGSKEKNNGVLLLLALSQREVRIEVGSGLEGALNDAKTGRIIDRYGMDALRENRFSEGLAAIYDALVNEVYLEYGEQPDPDYEPIDETEEESDALLVIRIVLIILIVVAALALSGRGRGHGGRGGRGGFPIFFFGGPGSGGFHGSGGFGGGGFSGGGGGFSGGGSSRGF